MTNPTLSQPFRLTNALRLREFFWTRLARPAWLVLAFSSIFTSLISIPYQYRTLQILCTNSECAGDMFALTPARLEIISRMGLNAAHYAAYTVCLNLITASIFVTAGLLIFLRTRDPIAYLVSLPLVLFAALITGGEMFTSPILANLIYGTLNYALFVSFVLGFYLFPDGRFAPPWSRWFAFAVIFTEFFYSYFPQASFSPHNFYPPLELVVWIGAMTFIPISQLYRYLSRSTPIQRQQTKWVVAGLSFSLIAVAVLVIALNTLPSIWRAYLDLASYTLMNVSLLAIPLTLLLAMLRSHLWNIDFILRKTLLYALLTSLLALVFFGVVTLLSSLFTASGGSRAPLITVLATLAIAALFNPLRHRLQHIINRRFYRRTYDAQKMLEAYSARIRNEVELDCLSEELLRVTHEALSPDRAFLWLSTYQDKN